MSVSEAELGQVDRDALERYWRAVELADCVRQQWEAAERPLTEMLANGVVVEAVILKLLREAEKDAERFARAIPRPKGVGGRPGEADHQRRLGESPAVAYRDRLIAQLPGPLT